MLQTTANQKLFTPSQTKKQELTSAGDVAPPQLFSLNFQPTSSVATFSFYVDEVNFKFCPRLSLSTHLALAWKDPAHACLGSRLQGYISDMEANPTRIMLVDGYFRISVEKIMHVLVKMRYDTDVLEGENYTVVSSVFRTIDKWVFFFVEVDVCVLLNVPVSVGIIPASVILAAVPRRHPLDV